MGYEDWGGRVDEIKRDFLRDGCVIIPGFLSCEELAELETRTERRLRRSPGGKTRKNLQQDDAWFEHQLRHGRQVGLIETLLDDAPEPATAAFFDRDPSESNAIMPHYDAIGHRRMGAVIWIALDRADEENGCLRYVKGTHKLDLPGKMGLDFDADSEGAFAVQADPGDAAIHSTLTVHWSEPNRSDRPRRAISYFYWAASSKGNGKFSKIMRNAGRRKRDPKREMKQAM